MWRRRSTGSKTGSGRDPGKAAQAADSKAVSRKPASVEPGAAAKRKAPVAKLPNELKPARTGKQPADAPGRPAGVGADGAQRQMGRGTWETQRARGRNPAAGESITLRAGPVGVGAVLELRGSGVMPVERPRSTGRRVGVMASFQQEIIRLSEHSRTPRERTQVALLVAFTVNDRGLPAAVFTLRKRLCIKAIAKSRGTGFTPCRTGSIGLTCLRQHGIWWPPTTVRQGWTA